MPDGRPEALPRRYGKYELLERIGSGGMAEVYRARLPGEAGFERPMVIKRLHPRHARQEDRVRMFVAEAMLAGRVLHKNVVQVFELGELPGGELFIAMEYVPGGDLKRLLGAARRSGRRVPVWLALHVTIEILEALAFAHELRDEGGRRRNVVHRDVSPENVFLSHGGEVKLGDFGVAQDDTREIDPFAGQLTGKVPYLSPEQIAGLPLDGRSDVFSAAVMLWESLAGRRLFAARTGPETMARICSAPRSPPSAFNPDVPPTLDACVLAALAIEREGRPPSARAFGAQLGDILASLVPRVTAADVQRVVIELLGAAALQAARAGTPEDEEDFAEEDLDEDAHDPTDGPATTAASATSHPALRAPGIGSVKSNPALRAAGLAGVKSSPALPAPGIGSAKSNPALRTSGTMNAVGALRPPSGGVIPVTGHATPPLGVGPARSVGPSKSSPALPVPGPGPTLARAATPSSAPPASPPTFSSWASALPPEAPPVAREGPRISTSDLVLAPQPPRTPEPAPEPDASTYAIFRPRSSPTPPRLPVSAPVSNGHGTPAEVRGPDTSNAPIARPATVASAPARRGVGFGWSERPTAAEAREPSDAPLRFPLWVRVRGQLEVGPLSWAEGLALLRETRPDLLADAVLSSDRLRWLTVARVVGLLGEELLPAERLLPPSEFSGTLKGHSLIAVLGQLARSRATGRLILLRRGEAGVDWRELHVLEGQLTDVVSNTGLLSMWGALMRGGRLGDDDLEERAHEALRRGRPMDELLGVRARSRLRRARAVLARRQLGELFGWEGAHFGLDTQSRPSSARREPLLALLPRMVQRKKSAAELRSALTRAMEQEFERAPHFDVTAEQLELRPSLREHLDVFGQGYTLFESLAQCGPTVSSKSLLVLAHLLLELGLLRPAGGAQTRRGPTSTR